MLKRLLTNWGVLNDHGRRSFEIPRQWSNAELKRFANRFNGAAINVSAWEDKDKEGNTYREYFSGCSDYFISNYGTEQGTLQGTANEYFIDLQADLSKELVQRFDVVFNHTCLEHVWDFRRAFSNLCEMSRDVLVIVVPWLQPVHADYGDYWRFSPAAMVGLCDENSFTALHVSWNEGPACAVYVLCIASRNPQNWTNRFTDFRSIKLSPALLKVPYDSAGKEAFSLRPWRPVVTRSISQSNTY